jgi:L-threonylcarbamoyladenylate synthase
MLLDKRAPGSARLAAEFLAAGKPAIIPCDTMYGIVGRVPESDPGIRALKGRGEDKPFIVLAADRASACLVADFDPSLPLLSLWPGPLTAVLPARGGGTVALRLPAEPWLRELLGRAGFPLYSTSANRSGNPALSSIASIIAEFRSDVGLIVDAGDMPASRASTIVDATVRPFRVLRQGELVVPGELLV